MASAARSTTRCGIKPGVVWAGMGAPLFGLSGWTGGPAARPLRILSGGGGEEGFVEPDHYFHQPANDHRDVDQQTGDDVRIFGGDALVEQTRQAQDQTDRAQDQRDRREVESGGEAETAEE